MKVKDDDLKLKVVMIRCIHCRVTWRKHYKRIQTIQNTGKSEVKLEKWIPSKEMHYCKPRVEVERKDWE